MFIYLFCHVANARTSEVTGLARAPLTTLKTARDDDLNGTTRTLTDVVDVPQFVAPVLTSSEKAVSRLTVAA